MNTKQTFTTVIEPSLSNAYSGVRPKVKRLPFVKKVGKGKQRRLHYWKPKRSGHFFTDSMIGQYYATEAINYMGQTDWPDLLRLIAMDMEENESRDSILEAIFWRTIGEVTLKGLQ